MKKFLLIAAAGLTAAFAASAADLSERPQYVTDLLVNGGFDDLGYVQSDEPAYWDGFGYDQVEAQSIPGWEKREGKWNGIVGIYEYTEEDIYEEMGLGIGKNQQYAHYRYCTVNGWTGFGLQQRVDGLTPGTEYVLDMYVGHFFSNPDANINYGFELYAAPLVPGEETGPEIVKMQGGLDQGFGEVEYYSYKFTATNEGVILRLLGYNWAGQDGNNVGDAYIDWDEVRLYDPTLEGINSVAVDTNVPQEIYNLQGVRMPANAELNGVYIVKTGNTVAKVVY